MQTIELSSVLEGLARSSLQAGILVVLVLGIQWALGARMSPRWRSALWLLVVARLLLPASFATTVSIYNLLPSWRESLPQRAQLPARPVSAPATVENSTPVYRPPTVQMAVTPEPSADPAGPLMSVSPGEVASAPSQGVVLPVKTKVSWQAIVAAVWASGVLALGTCLAISTFRLRRRFANALALNDPHTLEVLESCRARMGVRKAFPLVESSAITTPALFGLFHPRLLLPQGFAGKFPEHELQYVFLHELAHLKRRDLVLNWVVTALQVVHWFNPLLWLGFYRWRADREMACDALVLEVAGPEQNQEYGRTILRLLEGFTHHSSAPSMVGILEDKRQLHQRIRMIAEFRPTRRAGLLSAALIAILGVVCLTDAQGPKPNPASSSPKVRGGPVETNQVREIRLGSDPVSADPTNLQIQTLTVTVQDSATGNPLSGTEVIAPYLAGWNESLPKRLTDDIGRYTLRMPLASMEFRSQMAVFLITVQHPDYAARSFGWTRSQGDIYQMMPSEVVIKLEKGIRVGGRVADEHGQPLAGVRVLLSGSGYHGFNMGTEEQNTHEFPEVQQMDKANPAAITDNSGRWTFDRFPADLATMEITLIRPDESKSKFSTSPGFNNVNRFTPVSLADLLAGKAEFALRDGFTVRGIVVDETGKPIAGARVKEGYGHGNIELVSEFTTGADGRFERLNRAPRQWIYTASDDGRATVSAVAQVEAHTSEVRLVLPPARPLRVRVTDEEGKPLADCSVRLDSYRNQGQLLDWTGTTDADGRFTWSNAPGQEVSLYVIHPSRGSMRKFKVLADSTEKMWVLPRPGTSAAKVDIKAVDQATKQPIKIGSVSAEYNGEFSSKRLVEPGAPEARVEVKSSDFKVGMAQSYKIKVEAEGYEGFETEFIDLAEGDQQLEVALVRGGAVTGVLLLPEGKPASGARIWVAESRNAGSLFCNSPGRYYGDRFVKAQADNDGKFALPTLSGDPAVVITHSNGLLQTTLAGLKKQREVRLQPWGGVEGRLLVAGQPKGGVRVNLATLLWTPSLGLHLIYSSQSEPDGSFIFTNVPAGQYKLYQQQGSRPGRSITEDHVMPLRVTAGETVKIDYATEGRPVVGEAMADRADLEIDWQNDDHTLTLKQSPVGTENREDYASFKAFLAAHESSFNSPERMRQAREARTYVLVFERDGSFRAEDVPPGTYELKVNLSKPDKQQRFSGFERPEDQLGSLVKEVSIPPGKEPFDLGSLTVPIAGTFVSPKTPLVELNVQIADGKPLSLAEYRGKNLVLVFWANWSARSREQLKAIQAMQKDEFAKNAELAWLPVRMDGDLESFRLTAQAGAGQGQQAFAEKVSRPGIAQAFSFETLPAIFLLDQEGRIVGRDLDTDRLRAGIRRVLGQKQAQR